jgi:hypothetical protein
VWTSLPIAQLKTGESVCGLNILHGIAIAKRKELEPGALIWLKHVTVKLHFCTDT